MKIVIKQDELTVAAETLSYQIPFSKAKRCRFCKSDAPLFMLVNDDKGELVTLRPDDVRVWPHDCSTIAIYFCTNCGRMKATWNQG